MASEFILEPDCCACPSGLLIVIGPLSPDREPLEALTIFATQLVAMMSMPDTQKLHRLVIAGSIESPELGRLFWEAGPGRGFKIIATYLEQQKVIGKLAIDDVNRDAGMLIGMLVGGIALRLNLGTPAMTQTVEEQEAWASQTVRQFLRLISRGCYGFHARALHMRVTMMEAKAM